LVLPSARRPAEHGEGGVVGATLAAVLRQVLAGERGQQLLDGLDHVDSQLVAEVLRRLEGSQVERGG
jgi:hypothetical protein